MDKPKGKDYTNWAVLGLAIATALIIFTIVVNRITISGGISREVYGGNDAQRRHGIDVRPWYSL